MVYVNTIALQGRVAPQKRVPLPRVRQIDPTSVRVDDRNVVITTNSSDVTTKDLGENVPRRSDNVRSVSSSVLPNFGIDTDGGVVLFYHVAKTGGTSIRNLFETLQDEIPETFSFIRVTLWEYHIFADYYDQSNGSQSSNDSCDILPTRSGTRRMQSINKTVREFLSSSSSSENTSSPKTLLLELHGSEFGLKSLSTYLKRWRKLSQKSKKPFFAFTVIRDPAPFAMSYFNFFHYDCNERWCDVPYNEATESNLLLSSRSHPNLQCFLLMYDIHTSFYQGCPPTKQDCDDLYENVMKKQLDWVGTTEKLSEETIPLLERLLVSSKDEENGNTVSEDDEVDDEANDHIIVKNVGRKGLQKSLSPTTSAELVSMSTHDHTLYDLVQRDFVFEKMFPSATT